DRVPHRLLERAELGRERELLEIRLDERAQVLRPPRHRPPPTAARAAARPRSPWRARRAPGAPRSPRQGHRSTRAAPAPPRAAPADPPPCPAILRRSCSLLSLDPSKDAVHEPPRVFGGVALRERDRLVDHDLGRHLAAIELVDRDPQRAALPGAQ